MSFLKEVGRILASILYLLVGIPLALILAVFAAIAMFIECIIEIGTIPWHPERYIDKY